jgi:hypothetical protein
MVYTFIKLNLLLLEFSVYSLQNFVLDYFVVFITYLHTHWLYSLLRTLAPFVTDVLLILTYIVFRCEDIFTPNPHPRGPRAVLCPSWELAADTHLLKLQRMQNKVLRTAGNFLRCTPVRDLHTSFNLPYVYDYVRKLCRRQADEHVRGIGQGEARHRKYRDINLAMVKLTTDEVTKLPL